MEINLTSEKIKNKVIWFILFCEELQTEIHIVGKKKNNEFHKNDFVLCGKSNNLRNAYVYLNENSLTDKSMIKRYLRRSTMCPKCKKMAERGTFVYSSKILKLVDNC